MDNVFIGSGLSLPGLVLAPISLKVELTGRKTRPSVMPEAPSQASIPALAQAGMGAERNLFRLPIRSHDHPPPVTLLEVLEGESRGLNAPQPAADECGKEGAVTQPLKSLTCGRVDRSLGLVLGQPVAGAATPLASLMPEVRAGSSAPLSAASVASLRTAERRWLMLAGEKPPRAARPRKAGLGPYSNQAGPDRHAKLGA